MSEIPYKLYKVADITQVADSEKIAGAIFFDDATECVHVYGVDGTLVIYGSRKWTWSGINYNTFVNEVSVGDCVLWSATELTIVARKNISDNAVKVTLISDRGFNTLTFRKAATATEWSFVSSVVEDFDDFVKTSDVVGDAATPNTVVKRDDMGDVYMRGIVDADGNLYALPRSEMKDSGDADYVLQERLQSGTNIRSINGYNILGSGNVDIYNHNKGYFSSLAELTTTYPTAQVGDMAYVGTTAPYAIYKWDGQSQWYDSGLTGGIEVDTSKFLTATTLLDEELEDVEPNTFEGDLSINGIVEAKKFILVEASANSILMADGSTIDKDTLGSLKVVSVNDMNDYSEIEI